VFPSTSGWTPLPRPARLGGTEDFFHFFRQMQPVSEQTLWMRVPDPSQHDHFLRLFMEAQDSLRVYVRSLLFHREEEREVMQEVAAVLWRKFEGGMTRESFARRAFGVARMEVLSFRRDRARDRHCFGDEVFEILAQTVEEHSETLEAERRALGQCMEKLPAPQRQLLEAAYAPGVRIDQLALQMERTAMALYKTLHRLRLRLLECTRKGLAKGEL
jgi:RNA polymerase sigma-70 factor (ECF subfamily)